LALQLASFQVLHRIADDPPVLILDDVFAELDEQRRERLLDAVTAADQIIVTAAVAADIPERLQAQRFDVQKSDGRSTVAAGGS
jgi:DNA replication and repair protein RecF